METTLERELKLEPPDGFSLARLAPRLNGYVLAPAEWRRLHTVYWDTEDLRLTRWGCSLRFRLHDGWTLKLPVPREGDALHREEHEFPGDGDAVPAGALDLATAYLRGAVPHPVAELRTLRTARCIRDSGGNEIAEVVEDDVRVVAGTHVVRRFRQIEIELAGETPDGVLDALAELLRAEGAGAPDPTPKDVRALGGIAAEPEIVVPRLRARSRAEDVVRAAFAASAERIVRYDARLRLQADAAAIHDARVAVRRMRSDLRTLLPVLDRAWACALRDRLRRVGDELSAARDGDVLLERLARDAERLPDADRRRAEDLFARFRAERDRAYGRVRAMLREPFYVTLIADVVEAAKRPALNARAEERACDVVVAIMRGAWKPLRKAVRERSQPPSDRELHRIRIKAKGARYAADALAPVVGKPARRFAEAVEEVQTVLGEEHDAVVACERLHRESANGDIAFVAGELAALEYGAALRARDAWPPVWRAVARRKRRFWTT
jgi:CHAD domain-containing protein